MLIRHFLRFSFLIVLLGGCSVQLIAQYDSILDSGITDFEKRIDLHLIQMKNYPNSSFRQGLFDSLNVDLRALQTRANAIPQNTQTTLMFGEIIDQLAIIERMERRGSTSEAFAIADSSIDDDCLRTLKLELAKKKQ